MLSGQSAEIRESGRHGRFDLPERCGRLAQSKAALLPQTDLCKSKRELESTNQFFFFVSFFFPPNHIPPQNKNSILPMVPQIIRNSSNRFRPYFQPPQTTTKYYKNNRRKPLRKISAVKWTPPNTRNARTCPTWPTLTMPLCYGTWKPVIPTSLST